MAFFLSAIIITVTPLIWVIFLSICFIFWTYRKLVDIILRIKIGSKYGGLLNINDGFAVFETKHNFHIGCIAIHNSEKEMDMLEFLKGRLKKEVFSNPDDYPKLTGTLQTYMGYCYFLKNSAKLENYLKLLPVPKNVTLTEDVVKTMASNLQSLPLPQNNSATFEIKVLAKPIVVKDGEKTRYRYFSIVRVHHVVGDGTAIFAFFMNLFGNPAKQIYIQEILEKKLSNSDIQSKNNMSLRTYLIKQLKELLSSLLTMFNLIFLLFQKRLKIDLRKKDVNALHGPELSGETIIVWQTEETEKFVPIVKRIKNKFNQVTFSNVCVTALACSLGSYFKKNNLNVPDYITTFLTLVFELPKIDLSKPLPLEHRSSAISLEIPLKNYENGIQTLRKVAENTKNASYFEALSNRIFVKYIFAIFPLKIRAKLNNTSAYTALLSVVPGGSRTETVDGCYCENIIAYPPNFDNLGVSIGIMTYDNRLSIALQIDKTLLSSQEKAQEIADDFFKYLEILDVDTCNMK